MRYKVRRDELYNYSVALHYMQRLIQYSSFYNIIPGIVPTLIHYASITCLVIKFIADARYEKFAIKWFITAAICFPFLWIGSVNANADELIWILVYIISAKNVETKSVAKTIYAVCGVGTIVIVLCALLGIIPNNYEFAINSSGGMTVRMYMGFIHCNVFGVFLTTIFLCHFFIRFNRINKFDYFYGVFLFCICFFIAYSRTNAIIMLIALVSIRYYTKPKKSILKMTVLVMAFVMIFSIVLSINYDVSNQFMVEANRLLTGRLSAAKSAYDQYGFSILGQDFQTIFNTTTVSFGDSTQQQQVIDNAFMHLLIHYGILPSILLFWYYFSNVFWLYKNRKIDVLFVLFLSFIQGVSEGILYSTYNVALFILAATQYERMLQRKEKIIYDD